MHCLRIVCSGILPDGPSFQDLKHHSTVGKSYREEVSKEQSAQAWGRVAPQRLAIMTRARQVASVTWSTAAKACGVGSPRGGSNLRGVTGPLY